MTFRLRPPPIWKLPWEKLTIELDRHLPRLYDAHNALNGIAIKAPALDTGFSVQSGNVTITGSKLGIVTGLASVAHAVASVSTGSTPNGFTLSVGPSKATPGAIDIYVFQPTSASVTTPVLATSAVLVHWWATGASAVST